jgi:hypothetical protein
LQAGIQDEPGPFQAIQDVNTQLLSDDLSELAVTPQLSSDTTTERYRGATVSTIILLAQSKRKRHDIEALEATGETSASPAQTNKTTSNTHLSQLTLVLQSDVLSGACGFEMTISGQRAQGSERLAAIVASDLFQIIRSQNLPQTPTRKDVNAKYMAGRVDITKVQPSTKGTGERWFIQQHVAIDLATDYGLREEIVHFFRICGILTQAVILDTFNMYWSVSCGSCGETITLGRNRKADRGHHAQHSKIHDT